MGELLLEEPFVDCWADLLISAGWMDRSDMTLRECNWAIVRPDKPLSFLCERRGWLTREQLLCRSQVSYRAAPPAASRQERRASVESETDPRTDQVYFSFEEIVSPLKLGFRCRSFADLPLHLPGSCRVPSPSDGRQEAVAQSLLYSAGEEGRPRYRSR